MMEKRPPWLKVRYNEAAVREVAELMRDLKLNTVCREANCPNLGECYQKHTSTFLLLGNICTRNCRFCNVTTGHPLPPDPEEPMHVAQAAKKLGLRHVVLTCSTRDDLPDGGAEQFAKTVRAIRELCPGTTVETLISDMKMDTDALDTVLAAHPEVLNHNVETVRELQAAVRPQARYERSLEVLRYCKRKIWHGADQDRLHGGTGRDGGADRCADGRYPGDGMRHPDHRAVSPALAPALSPGPVRHAGGFCPLQGDGAEQGLPPCGLCASGPQLL